jgi:3-oxoacyl-(acyl-carrier-protein) synthase
MKTRIRGMGWITPLGADLDEVWLRVKNGERAEPREVQNPHSQRRHFYIPVPAKIADAVARNPRLRRSSAISCFAAAAGLAAQENAGIKMTPEIAERTAVIFAIASGGVVYTRKFYDQIAQQGANAASPLLFPETVYNAPASHLSALLGITGTSYTLVGDASVGIAALKLAEQLLATTDVQHCVVVGAEEVDWVLCEAYRDWRLVTSKPCIEIGSNHGTLLAEGAAALVLGREGALGFPAIHDGVSFFNRSQAREAIARVHSDLAKIGAADLVVSCANGTFIDAAESAAMAENFPNASVLHPKLSLGEALGASALLQTICAALALKNGGARTALVSTLGFNQQASGAVLAAV